MRRDAALGKVLTGNEAICVFRLGRHIDPLKIAIARLGAD